MPIKVLKVILLVILLSISLVASDIYGINAHLAENTVLKKIKDADIGWIRIDIPWKNIERQRGVFNYTNIDRVVNYAHNNNLSILGILAYTPDWANNKGENHPPNNVNDWKRFVNRTVKRYKLKIKHWNIWNEPNLNDFFVGSPNEYVNYILQPAVQTIRSIDSSAKIVGPEVSYLTSPKSRWDKYLRGVLNQGKQYIDIISIHVYDGNGAEAIMRKIEQGDSVYDSVIKVISANGCGGKPLWLTETGWSTASISESKQAEHYLELLKKILNSSYVDKVFFYDIIDVRNQSYFGILKTNENPKKAYYTYKNFIKNESDYIESEDDEENEDSEEIKKCAFEYITGYDQYTINKARNLKNQYSNKTNISKNNLEQYYSLSGELYTYIEKYPLLKKELRKLLYLSAEYSSKVISGNEIEGKDKAYAFKRAIDFLILLEESINNNNLKEKISKLRILLNNYKEEPLEKIMSDIIYNLDIKSYLEN